MKTKTSTLFITCVSSAKTSPKKSQRQPFLIKCIANSLPMTV